MRIEAPLSPRPQRRRGPRPHSSPGASQKGKRIGAARRRAQNLAASRPVGAHGHPGLAHNDGPAAKRPAAQDRKVGARQGTRP